MLLSMFARRASLSVVPLLTALLTFFSVSAIAQDTGPDAADAAGTAILAGILGGKQRMLVDVRDSELSRDSETLVQFIELAILPVAAGLEGLNVTRHLGHQPGLFKLCAHIGRDLLHHITCFALERDEPSDD